MVLVVSGLCWLDKKEFDLRLRSTGAVVHGDFFRAMRRGAFRRRKILIAGGPAVRQEKKLDRGSSDASAV
jgi:hypothetical protein